MKYVVSVNHCRCENHVLSRMFSLEADSDVEVWAKATGVDPAYFVQGLDDLQLKEDVLATVRDRMDEGIEISIFNVDEDREVEMFE